MCRNTRVFWGKRPGFLPSKTGSFGVVDPGILYAKHKTFLIYR